VNIAIVGKYTALTDAYKSLIEALIHGGVANNVRVKFDWIEGEVFETEDAMVSERLNQCARRAGARRFRGARLEGMIRSVAVRPRARHSRTSASASACRWR
jgi:CTP synthase